jgi:hypothetical protein
MLAVKPSPLWSCTRLAKTSNLETQVLNTLTSFETVERLELLERLEQV